MSSDETLSLHEAMDRFWRFLRRHCVSLAYVLKDSPNPKQWQFATGILLDLGGQKTVATAGHWVVNLQKEKDAGKLEEVHLRYPHVSEEFEQRRIEAAFVSAETMPVANQFDGAFIRLPEPVLNDIERHGNNFFAREQVLHGLTEDCHLAIVCGYPSQAIIVTENPAFYTKSGGKIFQHNHVQLGSLAFQSTLLQPKGNDNAVLDAGFNCDVQQLEFRPFGGKINSRPESGVSSAGGMSGGPVVAVAVGSEVDQVTIEPKLLGMQIAQKYLERKDSIEITQLDSVSAATLVDWIERTL